MSSRLLSGSASKQKHVARDGHSFWQNAVPFFLLGGIPTLNAMCSSVSDIPRDRQTVRQSDSQTLARPNLDMPVMDLVGCI